MSTSPRSSSNRARHWLSSAILRRWWRGSESRRRIGRSHGPCSTVHSSGGWSSAGLLFVSRLTRRCFGIWRVNARIVVQSSDILQYIFGKLFGRHQIAPDVSPSKTVEGFVGGVAGATAVGAVLCRITPFHPWQAAGLALTITLNGFLGGLVMSAIKRDRGVKDWGHLIDGHGG